MVAAMKNLTSATFISGTLIVFVMTGCLFRGKLPHDPPHFQAWNIHLMKDTGATNASFEVDLIGADEARKEHLERIPVTDYFGGQTSYRADLQRFAVSYSFPVGGTNEHWLSATNEIWKTWREDSKYIVVMTSLPFGSREPGYEPRRAILYLDKCYYDRIARKKDTLTVRLFGSWINVPGKAK